MSRSIVFDNVHRHFGALDVLRGLTFDVAPGEVFALLGRNGSGKTTALRILLGFLAPMHGRATILGIDSQAIAPVERDRIGYVAEGHRLYASMRIKDAIAFESDTRPRFRRSYAEHAVRRCGLSPAKRIGLLSRGQRAQLSLIFAVAGEPEVLIFDDPAMGLDVVMRREFLDAMIELLSDQGCSVLFSSHILTDVERIADRVGILDEGRLVVDATMVDLRKRVEKRFWEPPEAAGRETPEAAGRETPEAAGRETPEAAGRETPEAGGRETPHVDGLLRARPRRRGFDLTLLDFDAEREAVLRSGGASLSEPAVPTLEDLFLDITTRNEGGATPLRQRESQS